MDEAAHLSEKLRSEGQKLNSYMTQLRVGDWDVEVYTEDSTWTVRSTLAHLMTAEREFLRLFDQIRTGGPGVSQDFVIDQFNADQQVETRDLGPPELIRLFAQARAEMIELVASLSKDDLEKRGRHPYLGVTTLHEMIKMVYIHNLTHYRDVRRALAFH